MLEICLDHSASLTTSIKRQKGISDCKQRLFVCCSLYSIIWHPWNVPYKLWKCKQNLVPDLRKYQTTTIGTLYFYAHLLAIWYPFFKKEFPLHYFIIDSVAELAHMAKPISVDFPDNPPKKTHLCASDLFVPFAILDPRDKNFNPKSLFVWFIQYWFLGSLFYYTIQNLKFRTGTWSCLCAGYLTDIWHPGFRKSAISAAPFGIRSMSELAVDVPECMFAS